VNLAELTQKHAETNAIATLTAVRPLSRFGVLEIEEGGNVSRFREKPRMDTWINGGFFLFNKDIFNYLNKQSVLEQEPLASLSNIGRLTAFLHEGFWQPMDTLREAELLNSLWSTGKADWHIW
jgi:glucose-1-phosphate cytidylyltransferase